MTREGRIALAKIRKFSYILFFCYALSFFHNLLSNLFHVSINRILFGFIAIEVCQLIIMMLHIFKFATTIQGDKNKNVTTMIAARVRVFITIQIVLLLVQAINSGSMKSSLIDYGCIALNICNLFVVLQNLTILERKSFTEEQRLEANGQRPVTRRSKKSVSLEPKPEPAKQNKSNKSKKNYHKYQKSQSQATTSNNKVSENLSKEEQQKELAELKKLKKDLDNTQK